MMSLTSARRVLVTSRRSLTLCAPASRRGGPQIVVQHKSPLVVLRCATVGLVGGGLAGWTSSSLCLGEIKFLGEEDEKKKAVVVLSDSLTKEEEEKLKEEAYQVELRSKSWRWSWQEIVAHWLSFGCLTILQFLSTFLERAMGAGQAQQLMQLPGQAPLDQILQQVAYIFGVKALQLLADATRHGIAARLGARLAAEDRAIDPSCPPHESGRRLLIVDALPKLIVESVYAAIGAGAALAASPPFSAFFVAHELLAGQIIGFGAAYLGSKRDASASLLHDLHQDRGSDLALTDADIRLNDHQNVFERYVELGQLLGVSSFSLWASTLIDKSVLDQATFQKVMVFATTAMQASNEIAQSVDKMNRGLTHMQHLIKLQEPPPLPQVSN